MSTLCIISPITFPVLSTGTWPDRCGGGEGLFIPRFKYAYNVTLRDVGSMKSRGRRKVKRGSQETRDVCSRPRRERMARNNGLYYSSQQQSSASLSVANSTLLSWCLIAGGHRCVDAGQGTLGLGIVVLVAHNVISSWRAKTSTGTECDRRGRSSVRLSPES